MEVELFGQLGLDRPRRVRLDLGSPSTVREIAGLLGLDLRAVGLVSINGVQSDLEDPVPLTCRLCFFPPMAGG